MSLECCRNHTEGMLRQEILFERCISNLPHDKFTDNGHKNSAYTSAGAIGAVSCLVLAAGMLMLALFMKCWNPRKAPVHHAFQIKSDDEIYIGDNLWVVGKCLRRRKRERKRAIRCCFKQLRATVWPLLRPAFTRVQLVLVNSVPSHK